MLLLGNGVCSGGIATYYSLIGYGKWGTFGISTIIIFMAIVALHEFVLRRFNSKRIENTNGFKLIEGEDLLELIAVKRLRSWKATEIEEAVHSGDSLVVCDNLVLRTAGYERIHPGGKFTITKNFGRDVAKFFYGNYALTSGKLTKPHTHSR